MNLLDVVLARADELAESGLEGIEDAAKELAVLAEGNVEVISQARRIAVQRAEAEPTTAHKQVVSLIRRAMEIGVWDWDSYVETTPIEKGE